MFNSSNKAQYIKRILASGNGTRSYSSDSSILKIVLESSPAAVSVLHQQLLLLGSALPRVCKVNNMCKREKLH
jgi:hypothetical protein